MCIGLGVNNDIVAWLIQYIHIHIPRQFRTAIQVCTTHSVNSGNRVAQIVFV